MFSFYKKDRIAGYPDSLFRMEESLGLVPNVLMSKEDLVFLYTIIFSKKPSNVLEIGRLGGASSLVISGALADNETGRLYSVDIVDSLTDTVKRVLDYNSILITDSSVNLNTNVTLSNLKFQVFFIDGDHSAEMVINDLFQCLDLSDSESVILCHDASMEGVRKGIDHVSNAVPTLINCGRYGSDIQMLIY